MIKAKKSSIAKVSTSKGKKSNQPKVDPMKEALAKARLSLVERKQKLENEKSAAATSYSKKAKVEPIRQPISATDKSKSPSRGVKRRREHASDKMTTNKNKIQKINEQEPTSEIIEEIFVEPLAPIKENIYPPIGELKKSPNVVERLLKVGFMGMLNNFCEGVENYRKLNNPITCDFILPHHELGHKKSKYKNLNRRKLEFDD